VVVQHRCRREIAVIDTGIDETIRSHQPSRLSGSAITPIDNSFLVVDLSGGRGRDGRSSRRPRRRFKTITVMGPTFPASRWPSRTAWDLPERPGRALMAFRIFPNQNQYCNDTIDIIGNIGANTGDEAQAITDAIANGADVISLSIGSPVFDTVEFNAVEEAICRA